MNFESPIKLYHFHNGNSGGVDTVIRNIIRFLDKTLFEHHVIFTVNQDLNKIFQPPHLPHNCTYSIVTYSAKDNFFHTCRKLAHTVKEKDGIIIAHDWLELGMCSHIGLQNPVAFIMHGDYEYYYDLVQKHRSAIDIVITVAKSMSDKLTATNPEINVIYQRFPVPDVVFKPKETGGNNIVFIGRLEEAKGYSLLPEIDNGLRKKAVLMNWYLAGSGKKDYLDTVKWKADEQLHLLGELRNEELLRMLSSIDYILLPSTHEGMPLSVIESMKAGAIPITNDIAGGIQELVVNDITGYKIIGNKVEDYVNVLSSLHSDKAKRSQMSLQASELAKKMFDPNVNAAKYSEIFRGLLQTTRKSKKAECVYGSRLDKPWIPNSIVRMIRK